MTGIALIAMRVNPQAPSADIVHGLFGAAVHSAAVFRQKYSSDGLASPQDAVMYPCELADGVDFRDKTIHS